MRIGNKIGRKINSTIKNIKLSTKRFPTTIIISVILTCFLIYLNEIRLDNGTNDTLEKINMALGLGIPLSLSIKLLVERFFSENKFKSLSLHLTGLLLLIIYYFNFLQDYEIVSMTRYLATMIFLILTFLYMPRLKNWDNYEYYIMDIYYNLALTFIYSLVLYLGIAVILLTINGLFDILIKSKLYYYMFLIISLIFSISLFTSRIPKIDDEFRNIEYTKALKVLILYIVIPLISIYTAILYLYFAKIIITMEWPSGLVSHLVLWYSTISVGVIFLITPIIEENKVARLFKIWFPKIIIPILFMMFISISKRTGQYGITENRYYLIVLGTWVTGIMLYFSLKKPLKNIIIPISISLVILNSVFGPLSSFAISKYSQNKRLKNILNSNNMIDKGKIIPNSEVDDEDKREINNIISYFHDKHSLEDIKVFPKDIDINKVDKLTGFKYEHYNPYIPENQKYFYYGINESEKIIDIKDYDYYIKINSWDNKEWKIEELNVEYKSAKNTLVISTNEEIILEQEITSFIKDIHEEQISKDMGNEKMSQLTIEDMTYEMDFLKDDLNRINMKFVFININGMIDDSNQIQINDVDFILLVKK